MSRPPAARDPNERRIGSYRILRKLGAGGMGDVFLARDDRLDRNVAIKRVLAGSQDSAELRERLRREAKAAASLSHPSVVRVYDIVEDPDGDSIVMEYLEGRTLQELLLAGELEGPAALEILLQVTDGLDAAHRHGLVHRDLKGDNVMVTSSGDAKILDFGLAKVSDQAAQEAQLTKTGLPVGTLRSMSPEQCEGEGVDARSDLFSLGVLMYEMFGGRTPFGGRTLVQTLANLLGSDPQAVSELNGSVPPELSDLIAELLEKEPDHRPPSAAAVADRLEEIRRSESGAGLVAPRLILPESSSVPQPDTRPETNRSARRRRRRTLGETSADRTHAGARRGRLAALGLAGVALASIVLLQVVPRGERPSANRVMVFPLPVSGGTNLDPTSGEDVATMIGAALDGTEPLHWIDAWPLLDAATRDDIRGLGIAQAADLAASRGCGYFIWGRVVASGDSATVVLNLYDVRGDPVASAEATGSVEVPWRAGLGAVNHLLTELIPTPTADAEATLAARPPAAVARFLLGEHAFRRAHIEDAREHFETSFALDPTFDLAGLRGAQAAAWAHDLGTARSLLEAVLELSLRPRSESFARGLLAYVDLDAEGAIGHLADAVAEDSTFSAAWASLGEVYRHRAPRLPWLGEERPFARALELDSVAANVLFHRLEEVIREGDLATARRLREHFLDSDPDSGIRMQIDLMFRCLADGPVSSDWQAEVGTLPANVEFAGGQFLMRAGNLPCAESLMRGVLRFDTTAANAEARYWASYFGVTASKLAQGRFGEVRRLMDAASAGFETFQSLIDRSTVDEAGVVLPSGEEPWMARPVLLRSTHEGSLTRWSELAVLLGSVYPQLTDLAERGAADLRALAGPDYMGAQYRTSLWMLGLWEARQGRPEEAARAVARIREIAAGQEDDVLRAYSFRVADALDIHRIIAEGDETEALERLRVFRSNAEEGWIFVELNGSFSLERLVHARLEERLGDPERALALALAFDEPSALTNVVYLPHALALCARTADRLDQPDRARACRARLEALGWTPGDLAM